MGRGGVGWGGAGGDVRRKDMGGVQYGGVGESSGVRWWMRVTRRNLVGHEEMSGAEDGWGRRRMGMRGRRALIKPRLV